MKKRTIIIYTIIILIIGLGIGVTVNSKTNFLGLLSGKSEREVISGYSFEKIKNNVINKEFDGKYLDPFVTIALEQDEFSIKLKGIKKESKVFLIDPNTGEMKEIKNDNELFSITTKLEKDINYGIIVDYNLVGSIRVVQDFNSIDEGKFYRDILINLGCGL